MQLSDFFQGTKEEFESAVVNEPSVFESLKFYCYSVFGLPFNVIHSIVIVHLLGLSMVIPYFVNYAVQSDFLQHMYVRSTSMHLPCGTFQNS